MRDKLITTLKEYKETYSSRLENHISKYEDYDELDFLYKEMAFYQNCYKTASVAERKLDDYDDDYLSYRYSYLNEFEYAQCCDEEINGSENYDVKKIIKNEIKCLTDGYDLEICNQLLISFTKIISFLETKKAEIEVSQLQQQMGQTAQLTQNKLKWQGTQLEFTEVFKALIQSNQLNSELSQKEVFKRLKEFFNVDEYNENEKLQDTRKRTNTMTPFLNSISVSLENWIKRKD